jgi:hypothetical protein
MTPDNLKLILDRLDGIDSRLDRFDAKLFGNGQKGLVERQINTENALESLRQDVREGREQRNFHIKMIYGLLSALIVALAGAWYTAKWTAKFEKSETTIIEKSTAPVKP